MSSTPMEKEDLAALLALQGLEPKDADLPGMLGMARDLADSAGSMRGKRDYALESLAGFSLVHSFERREPGDE